MNAVGLFAGIGGIELGLRNAGHRALMLCESDPAALAVLEARFENVTMRRDVRRLRTLPQGTDLVAAGFPCQDLSQVGRTDGLDGEKSGLVRRVFELLETRPAPWVLLENVPFLLRLKGGAGMRYLLSEFERLGYRWAYRVVNTMAFGLPHRRERVFILASRDGRPEDVLFGSDLEPDVPADCAGRACGFYWTEGNSGIGWAVDAVPTLKGGSGVGIPSAPAIWFSDGRIATPDIRDAEALQGFPRGWTEPANALNARLRWRLVGNAVSVPVARWIGERLNGPAGDVASHSVSPLDLERGPLPNAGYGSKATGAHAVSVGSWPVSVPRPALAAFLRCEPKPLSFRAANGFLQRLARSGLRREPAFEEALRRHVARVCPPSELGPEKSVAVG